MLKHRRGYSERMLKKLKQFLLVDASIALVCAAVAGSLSYRALFLDGDLMFAVTATAVFLFVSWWAYCAFAAPINLSLYFEEKVPGDWVWSQVLARHAARLDEVAEEKGWLPLSLFGFADDFHKDRVMWHEAQEGLTTVRGLSGILHESPVEEDEVEAIRLDLSKMEARLQEAADNQVRFCLILHVSAINGMEVEQRKGFF